MMTRRWMLPGLLAALALLGACSTEAPDAPGAAAHAEHADHGEEGEGHAEASPLALSDAQLAAVGVRFETLAPMRLQEELRAPGEVLDNAYGTTLITPSIPGLVVARHARLGDEVAAGALLVTLSSIDVAQARGEWQLAEQEWKRVSALGEQAVSGRRFAEARVAVEQARAKARAWGIDENGGAGGQFTLAAPHAGRITEDAFIVGERVEPGRTLFRLVDESVVWVDAKLTPELAQRIAVGSDAFIVAGDARLPGKVTLRAHRTAEATRNAVVRIEVANTGDHLHAGDYVDALLQASGAAVERLAVPTAALVQLEGRSVVFRRSAEGVEPVEVQAGPVIGERTEIIAGLAAGESIAVSGTFTLKSRLLKSRMGEGHVH